MAFSFVLTGGGTGGHVFPALAVADVLRSRGHRILYIGTEQGIEARLVQEAGYEMQFIKAGALNRVGRRQQATTALLLPGSIWSARKLLRQFGAQAVFSLGGFVAGPVMAAAASARIPLVIMEPNAIPGFANRRIAPYVFRALVGFESTSRWFPAGRSELTGVPVRQAFFNVQRDGSGPFSVLITGGSRGARSLNRAARESLPRLAPLNGQVRLTIQTGAADHADIAAAFANSGVAGTVTAFIQDMPSAFAAADLVVGRSGAGAVNELAAAGMPSVLIPFPFAADNHQQKNAEILRDAHAARMVLDRDLTGERLFQEIETLRAAPEEMAQMRRNVRQFARPGAAARAADVLEEAATKKCHPTH